MERSLGRSLIERFSPTQLWSQAYLVFKYGDQQYVNERSRLRRVGQSTLERNITAGIATACGSRFATVANGTSLTMTEVSASATSPLPLRTTSCEPSIFSDNAAENGVAVAAPRFDSFTSTDVQVCSCVRLYYNVSICATGRRRSLFI